MAVSTNREKTGIYVPPSSYLGVVASRGIIPNATVGANKQSMSRTKHMAMDEITSLQLVIANYYVASGGTETNAGGVGAYTAAIEYPAGTLKQVFFSGSASGSAADGGTLVSDPVGVAIPRGAAFYVRMWQNNAAGIVYSGTYGLNNAAGSVPVSGEWVIYGATTADLTMSTSNANNTNVGVSVRPAAIIGYTSRPTFFLAGDSRLGNAASNYDTVCNSFGGVGEVERSVGRSFGIINAGCSAQTLANAISNYTKRLALSQYCSQIICEYGINDFVNGASADTTLTNLATFAALFGGKPFYQTTITPKSASTDSWATTANQTTDATANGPRVTFNDAVRAGRAAPITGCIEVADQLESARNSGLWKVTGSANGYTADGLHGNAAGNALAEVSTAFQVLGG